MPERHTPRLHVEHFTDAQFSMLANAMLALAKEKIQFAIYYDFGLQEYALSHPLKPAIDAMNRQPDPPRTA